MRVLPTLGSEAPPSTTCVCWGEHLHPSLSDFCRHELLVELEAWASPGEGGTDVWTDWGRTSQ